MACLPPRHSPHQYPSFCRSSASLAALSLSATNRAAALASARSCASCAGSEGEGGAVLVPPFTQLQVFFAPIPRRASPQQWGGVGGGVGAGTWQVAGVGVGIQAGGGGRGCPHCCLPRVKKKKR